MINPKAQIVATIGPASGNYETLKSMIDHDLGVIRLNFSWGDFESHAKYIALVRELEKECGKDIPIIIDLPGPRIQEEGGHTYDHQKSSVLTEEDVTFIEFAVLHDVEYLAVSFVAGPDDIDECRKIIESFFGKQKIIAKIERAVAVHNLDEIIAKADAVMVARGDLGNEVPLEKIPFIQDHIVKRAKKAGKPVIVATQMLLSMVDSPSPTRAEVTDVANATLQGADAVMLSEETAKGKYPVEAVTIMEKIILEAERHMGDRNFINPL